MNGIEMAMALAVLVERLVENFGAPLFSRYGWPKEWQKYVALVLGLLVALGGQINALAGLPGLALLPPVVGVVLTGVLIGGGSSLVHEFFAKSGDGIPPAVMKWARGK